MTMQLPLVADSNENIGSESKYARMMKLHDGREVSNYSREWIQECEAISLLNMPSKEARRQHLAEVERKRGSASRNDLERLAHAIWSARRG